MVLLQPSGGNAQLHLLTQCRAVLWRAVLCCVMLCPVCVPLQLHGLLKNLNGFLIPGGAANLRPGEQLLYSGAAQTSQSAVLLGG